MKLYLKYETVSSLIFTLLLVISMALYLITAEIHYAFNVVLIALSSLILDCSATILKAIYVNRILLSKQLEQINETIRIKKG